MYRANEGMKYRGHVADAGTLVKLITRLDEAERAVYGPAGIRHRRSLRYAVAEAVMDQTAGERSLEDLSFVDFDAWRIQKRPGQYESGLPPRRIAVSAHVTRPGNFSVTVHPAFYAGNGTWTHAPEWRIRFDQMSTPIMERPRHEILFVRDVRDFFQGVNDWNWQNRDAREAALREIEAEAIHFAYHAVIKRISERFEVAIADDLKLAEKPKQHDPMLSIVDTDLAHRENIVKWIAGLPEQHGYSADRLWATFTECRREFGFHPAKASRRLRTAEGPASGFTPASAEHVEEGLRQAVAYGIYKPVEAPAVRLSEKEAAPRVVRPKPESRIQAPAPRAGGLSYEGMAVAPLPPEVAEEFGVASTMEMVEKLNELYRRSGQPPLPHGSFPTGNSRLKGFVKLYRSEMAQDEPAPPSTGI